MRGTLRFHRLRYRASANKPTKPKLIGYPPDLGINIPNLLHVSLGPSSVFSLRRRDPRFALRGPRTCGLAAVHAAPVPVRDDGVLAGRALTRFCEAPLARPVGAEYKTGAY